MNKKLFIKFLPLFCLLVTFSGWSMLAWSLYGDKIFGLVPTPPTQVPINLTKAGNIAEMEVQIKEDVQSYVVGLHFFFTQRKKEAGFGDDELYNFVGFNKFDPFSGKQISFSAHMNKEEKWDLSGVTIPIKLAIYKLNDNNSSTLVIDKTYKTRGRNANSFTYLTREFAGIELAKGRYLIKAKTLKDFDEFRNGKVELFIDKFKKK